MNYYIKMSLHFVFLLFFLSGCMGAYKYDFSNKEFKSQNNKENNSTINYVIFSNFDIPHTESRAVRTSDRIEVNIYDVTTENKYIGRMDLVGFLGSKMMFDRGNFIEYEASVGQHIFMLVYANTSLMSKDFTDYHVDFIKADVTKEKRTYISISLKQKGLSTYMMKSFIYGGGLLPFFTLVDIDDKYFDYCSTLKWDNEENAKISIEQYMQDNSINLNQKYFKNYCGMLANPKKVSILINPDKYDEFNKTQANVQKLKDENLPLWLKSINKSFVFPLIQPSLNR